MDPLSNSEMALRLGAAVVCCGIIGLERQERHKAAGLRTLILVGLGACVFVVAVRRLGATIGGTGVGVEADASALSRVVQGVIAGVGFLGAGTVLRAEGHIRGMTTAATVWVTCAIGVACGVGELLLAATTAVMTWIALEGLGWCEKKWMKGKAHHHADTADTADWTARPKGE